MVTRWFLISAILLLIALLMTGCGVAQEEYDAVLAERDALTEEIATLESKVSDLESELSDITNVFPPRDFSSYGELRDWLLENDVSEKPPVEFAEDLYSKALDIQEDALNDGYIISVNIIYEQSEEVYYIACTAIIEGDIWWWDVEDDSLANYSTMYHFMKVK